MYDSVSACCVSFQLFATVWFGLGTVGLGLNWPFHNIKQMLDRITSPVCVLFQSFSKSLNYEVKKKKKNMVGQIPWRSWSNINYNAPGTMPTRIYQIVQVRKTQHLGERTHFLPLVRRDIVTCIEVKDASLWILFHMSHFKHWKMFEQDWKMTEAHYKKWPPLHCQGASWM